MMKKSIFAILLFIILNLYSQTAPNILWNQNYPFAGRGSAIMEVEDNNFVVSAKGSDNFYSLLMKIDVNGDTLWTNTYSSSSQGGNDFIQMPDGGYCLSGFDRLIKTSPDGVFQWESIYNYDEIFAMDITDNNELVVCGDEITKLDSYGNELWSYSIPRCYDIKSTNDNGYILAGRLPSYNLQQALLLKMDSTGSEEWRVPIGTTGGNYGKAVTETSDNGYVITGSYFMGDGVGSAVFAMKTNSSGDAVWFNTYDIDFTLNPGMSVIETVDNNFIILTANYQVIKIDGLGNEIWTLNLVGYDGGSIEEKREIIQTSDQGFMIVGRSSVQSGRSCRITCLESDLNADFSATPTSGFAPLAIDFTDQSIGMPDTWEWDFQNDGIIDSYVQNPSWVYSYPGIYAVSLTVYDGVLSDTEVKTDFIAVLDSATLIQIPLDYPTIQAGINVAVDGDTILVHPGTYMENINFNGKNITVASLFLTTQDTTYISQTIIDGNQNGNVVTFQNGETSDATLSGFTIKNGFANGVFPANSGGGIYCYQSSPTLKNLIITENTANCGGAIGCWNYSNPEISYVSMKNNNAEYGGGITCSFHSSPEISNSLIRNNSSVFQGGGFHCFDHSSPSVVNTVVLSNNSFDAGGIYIGSNSSPSFIGVEVLNNYASCYGGGIKTSEDSEFPIFEDCLIANNVSGFEGAGIFLSSVSGEFSNLTVVNNTILAGNIDGSGIWYSISSYLPIRNCIFTHNNGGGCIDGSGNLAIFYSNFYNNVGGNGQFYAATGVIYNDPQYVDFNNGDYHLSSNSPCIDAGDPDIIYNDPDGTRNDMGAYFFYQFVCDFSCDLTSGTHPLSVNFSDESYGILTSWEWDFDNDGTIDSYEQNPFWVYTAPGVYSVSLTITDADSVATETKTDLITITNMSPIIQTPLGNLTMFEDEPDSTSINLNDHFFDPNGDDLTFTFSGNDSIAVEILSNGSVIFTPNENWFGQETIYFTADDLWGDERTNTRARNSTDRNPISESKLFGKADRNTSALFSESRVLRAERESRATVTDSLIVTVVPVNDPPWFTSLPDTLVLENEIYQYIATAEDIENDPLTFAAPLLPNWLTFTPAIGLLIGIPTNDHVGYHPVTITVTDGIIPTPIEQNFIIYVQNVNDPPVINFPAFFAFPEDGSATYDFTAYITDVDNTYDELTLSWEGNININIVNDNWDVTFSSNLPEWFGEEVVTFTVDDGVNRSSVSANPLVSYSESNIKINRSRKAITDTIQRDIVSESITVYCTYVNDPPELLDWQPQELEFSIYQDSTVIFMVSVWDVDSELVYNWFLNEVLLPDEIDSVFVHTFTEVGDFTVQSVIADEDNEVSQEWLVHVNEQVGANLNLVPVVSQLYQNYPNPFNPTTTIEFNIKENEKGVLSIYNIKGECILRKEFPSGSHNYQWYASKLASGIYLYKLQTPTYHRIKKSLLLK